MVAVVFLILSMDEIAGLHERLGDEISSTHGGRARVLVLGPLLVLVGLSLVRLAGALLPWQRQLVVAGLALYIVALLTESSASECERSP